MYKLATCKYKVGEAFETDIFPKNIKIKFKIETNTDGQIVLNDRLLV